MLPYDQVLAMIDREKQLRETAYYWLNYYGRAHVDTNKAWRKWNGAANELSRRIMEQLNLYYNAAPQGVEYWHTTLYAHMLDLACNH